MDYDEEDMSFAAADQAGPGLQSTPKIPPSFDGRSSWFSYEEAIDDWVDITILDQEKQGPSLKNRLVGDAAVYKPLLGRANYLTMGHHVIDAACLGNIQLVVRHDLGTQNLL